MPKTVKVRVACVWSEEDSAWRCYGESDKTVEQSRKHIDANGVRPHITIVADLPIPEGQTVEARAEGE